VSLWRKVVVPIITTRPNGLLAVWFITLIVLVNSFLLAAFTVVTNVDNNSRLSMILEISFVFSGVLMIPGIFLYSLSRSVNRWEIIGPRGLVLPSIIWLVGVTVLLISLLFATVRISRIEGLDLVDFLASVAALGAVIGTPVFLFCFYRIVLLKSELQVETPGISPQHWREFEKRLTWEKATPGLLRALAGR
jgi:hypothetical protein